MSNQTKMPDEKHVTAFLPPKMTAKEAAENNIAVSLLKKRQVRDVVDFSSSGKNAAFAKKSAESASFQALDLSHGREFVSSQAEFDRRGIFGKARNDENAENVAGFVRKTSQPKGGKDSPLRRVAKFLVLLGLNDAAKVMKQLDDDLVKKIAAEIATVGEISNDEADEILSEFQAAVSKQMQSGGVSTAKEILSKAFGEKTATDIIEKSVPFPDGNPYKKLAAMKAEILSQTLDGEPAWLKALILSQLPPKNQAAILDLLESGEKVEIVKRLAKLGRLDVRVLRQVGSAVLKKSEMIAANDGDEIDGRRVLTEILRAMDSEAGSNVLDSIEAEMPELHDEIRSGVFTAEDAAAAPAKFLQKLLAEFENEELARMIAGKSSDFREKILANVSSERRKMILSDEEALKPMRKSDVSAATEKFCRRVRDAWEAGEVFIKTLAKGEWVT